MESKKLGMCGKPGQERFTVYVLNSYNYNQVHVFC